MMRGTQVTVHCKFVCQRPPWAVHQRTKNVPVRLPRAFDLDILGRHRDVVEIIGFPVKLLVK